MRSRLAVRGFNVARRSGTAGALADRHDGSQFFSAAADERPDRIVLVDGGDRWRSLLLGAPPLLP